MIATDEDLIEAVRSGCHTAQEVLDRLIGLGLEECRTDAYYKSRRASTRARLTKLTKRGRLKVTGCTGPDNARTWDVVE